MTSTSRSIAGGNVYKGNVFSGPNSITGGSADPRNNVESVFLPAGITGPVAVIVTAANINSNGVPNNASALDQDFALVAYNVVAGTLPVLAVQSAAVTGGNLAIDPNECNDLDLVVKNWGTATATGIVATLSTSTPGVAIAQTTLRLSQPGSGQSSTNTTPFTDQHGGEFRLRNVPVALTATLATNQGTQVSVVGRRFGSSPSARRTSPRPMSQRRSPISGRSSRPRPSWASPVRSDKVTVSFHLTHTFDDDLVISLVAPDGTTVELTSNNGGSGNDYGTSCGGTTVFDDAAGASITAGAAPFVGTFRPEQPLSTFVGQVGGSGQRNMETEDYRHRRTGCRHPAMLDADDQRNYPVRRRIGACQRATFTDVPPDHAVLELDRVAGRGGNHGRV